MTRDGRTLDLFRDWTPPVVEVRFEAGRVQAPTRAERIARAVSATLEECARSRAEVAEAMGISDNALNAYASQARNDHNISLDRAFGLIEATHDPRILAIELDRLGFVIIPKAYLGAVEEAMCADQIEHLETRKKLARRSWKGGRA